LRSRNDEAVIPMSVMMTGGRNQFETSPHSHGNGLRHTAERVRAAAVAAAVCFPWVTAIVLMLWVLSPSMSAIPFVISLPVFDRKAMATKSRVEVASCPMAKPP